MMSASSSVLVIGLSSRRLDDGAGDGARAALLAEAKQNFRKLCLILLIDDIGCACAFAGHAHVERTITHEGKAACRFVELHGGDAEIENDGIGRREACSLGDLGQLSERRRLEAKARRKGFGEIGGELGRERIAVEGQKTAFGAGEYNPRIPPGAECAVDIMLAVFWRQGLDDGGHQYRGMTSRSACGFRGLSLAATRHRSRTPSLRPSANGRFPAPSSLR